MFASTVIRRCLLPAAAIVAEAKLIQPSDVQYEEINACRPSELPIYTTEPPIIRTEQEILQEQEPTFIQNSVRSIRQNLENYHKEYKEYEKLVVQNLLESKQNADWLVDFLRQEDNTLPKAGAIGIGALTGLIFGLRGRFFKRTIYATTGALAMAAICYPQEAAQYGRVGLAGSKKYLTIVYNFVSGVKKDDPPLELPSFPKLPRSFPEAWEMVKSTASSFISDEPNPKVKEVANTPSVSTAHPMTLSAAVLEGQVPPYPESLTQSEQLSGEPESLICVPSQRPKN